MFLGLFPAHWFFSHTQTSHKVLHKVNDLTSSREEKLDWTEAKTTKDVSRIEDHTKIMKDGMSVSVKWSACMYQANIFVESFTWRLDSLLKPAEKLQIFKGKGNRRKKMKLFVINIVHKRDTWIYLDLASNQKVRLLTTYKRQLLLVSFSADNTI